MSHQSLLEGKQSRREFMHDAARLGVATVGVGFLGSRSLTRPRVASAQSEPITLEFWNTFSDAEIKLLHELGDEYMRLNPNVTINFYEIPFDQRPTKVPTAVETNSLPDILRGAYPDQWYLAALGKLLPLDEHLGGWEMHDAIFDIAWQEATYNGEIIGIPQDKFTSVFCYNKDKFRSDGVEAFPTTWDELIEACKKLTHDDEYGIALTFGGGIAQQLEPLIFQAGGRPFDDQGLPAMDSAEGVAALQFAVDLANEHKVMPPGVANFAYAETDDALKSGKLGMAVFGSWQIANYRLAQVPWELGIAPWPAGPGGQGTVASTAMYHVINTTKHPKEAVELLKWLVSKENALRWAKTLDHEPIDEFTAADPYFQQPIFEAFEESLPFAHTRPAEPRWNAISRAYDVAAQKAVLGDVTPEQAVEELAKTVEEIVNQGG